MGPCFITQDSQAFVTGGAIFQEAWGEGYWKRDSERDGLREPDRSWPTPCNKGRKAPARDEEVILLDKPDDITVEVFSEQKNTVEKISLVSDSTIEDLLRKMNLLRDEYVVLVEGQVLTELERLKDGDHIHLIRASSGG